jgi:serine/threonine protein kinase
MKLCPLCQHCYEDKVLSCAHDRRTLIADRPGSCIIARKYKLDRLLASNAAQAVYAGRHLETDRPYAIKLLLMEPGNDAEALKNFRQEALATAQLNTRFDHQHAAKTYDCGLLSDGNVYLITELIVGQSLRQHMDEAGPLPVATAARIAQHVADGLEAAHRCGVIHQGLEPANIILVRDYEQQLEAKIIDFGFASLLRHGAEAKGHGGSISRRPDGSFSSYVAPEQRLGQNTDARSDIYSLGVILYEMLSGRLPFSAGAETVAGHILRLATL